MSWSLEVAERPRLWNNNAWDPSPPSPSFSLPVGLALLLPLPCPALPFPLPSLPSPHFPYLPADVVHSSLKIWLLVAKIFMIFVTNNSWKFALRAYWLRRGLAPLLRGHYGYGQTKWSATISCQVAALSFEYVLLLNQIYLTTMCRSLCRSYQSALEIRVRIRVRPTVALFSHFSWRITKIKSKGSRDLYLSNFGTPSRERGSS